MNYHKFAFVIPLWDFLKMYQMYREYVWTTNIFQISVGEIMYKECHL